jgi:hypothetical protein
MMPPALQPVTVSDRTCEAVLGVSWRPLRQLLRDRGITYARIGRRPVVRVSVVLDALEVSEPSRKDAVAHARAVAWNEEEIIARAAARR